MQERLSGCRPIYLSELEYRCMQFLDPGAMCVCVCWIMHMSSVPIALNVHVYCTMHALSAAATFNPHADCTMHTLSVPVTIKAHAYCIKHTPCVTPESTPWLHRPPRVQSHVCSRLLHSPANQAHSFITWMPPPPSCVMCTSGTRCMLCASHPRFFTLGNTVQNKL